MKVVYILALNHNEAKSYIRKNPAEGVRFVVLNALEQLMGTTNPEVYISPNAFLRPDYNDFIDLIRTRTRR